MGKPEIVAEIELAPPEFDFAQFFHHSILSEDNKKERIPESIIVQDVYMHFHNIHEGRGEFRRGVEVFAAEKNDIKNVLCHVFWTYPTDDTEMAERHLKERKEFPVFRGFDLTVTRRENEPITIQVDDSKHKEFLLALNRHVREILDLPNEEISYKVDPKLIGIDLLEGNIKKIEIDPGLSGHTNFAKLLNKHPEIESATVSGYLFLRRTPWKFYDIENVIFTPAHSSIAPFLMRFNGKHARFLRASVTGLNLNVILHRWVAGLLPALQTFEVVFGMRYWFDVKTIVMGLDSEKWDPKKRPRDYNPDFMMKQHRSRKPEFGNCETAVDLVCKVNGRLATLKLHQPSNRITFFVWPSDPFSSTFE